MTNWFTGDTHYCHANIISKFVFRKFRTVAEMNRVLIERHNSRVKPGDTVFHLGDFKLTNEGPNFYELKQQLNGNLVHIQGNHDRNNGCNSAIKYLVINTYGRDVLLVHRPDDAEILMQRCKIDLAFVGHVHEKWKFRYIEGVGDLINVGVDQWDYTPVDAKQIFKAYKNWRD